MNTLQYTTTINAPVQTVWETMLGPDTYRDWTSAFQEGSYYDGDWAKGSAIRFLTNEDGNLSGLFAEIVENIPYQFISIEHRGEVVDGKEVTDSESAKAFIGAHENYTFTEKDGVTTLDVELKDGSMPADMAAMFDDMWPPALDRLKELCEA